MKYLKIFTIALSLTFGSVMALSITEATYTGKPVYNIIWKDNLGSDRMAALVSSGGSAVGGSRTPIFYVVVADGAAALPDPATEPTTVGDLETAMVALSAGA